jgi:hypothetical protein
MIRFFGARPFKGFRETSVSLNDEIIEGIGRDAADIVVPFDKDDVFSLFREPFREVHARGASTENYCTHERNYLDRLDQSIKLSDQGALVGKGSKRILYAFGGTVHG